MSICKQVLKKTGAVVLFLSLSSLIIQVIFIAAMSDAEKRNQSYDYKTYYKPVAENIKAGMGCVLSEDKAAVRYPPGFPYILSIIYKFSDYLEIKQLKAVEYFNILATILSSVLLYLCIKVFFGFRIAFIASCLWISYPFYLWLIKQPNPEIPYFLFFITSVFCFCLSRSRYCYLLSFLSGFFCGIAVLIRPAGLFLTPLFVFFKLFFREQIKCKIISTVFICIGFAMVMVPWEYYAYRETGSIIPASTGGLPSIMDGLTFAIKPGAGGDRVSVPDDVLQLMASIKGNNSLESTGDLLVFLANQLIHNPAPLIKLYFIKSLRAWYGTDEMWHESLILVVQLFYILPSVFGICLSFKRNRKQILYFPFFLSIIVAKWLMTILVLSILRYMVPAMAFMMLFYAIFITWLLDKLYAGAPPRRAS